MIYVIAQPTIVKFSIKIKGRLRKKNEKFENEWMIVLKWLRAIQLLESNAHSEKSLPHLVWIIF